MKNSPIFSIFSKKFSSKHFRILFRSWPPSSFQLLSALTLCLILQLACPVLLWALTSREIIVVVNTRMSGAIDIARYYMQRRNIPEKNLVTVALTLDEDMPRDEYDDKLKPAVLKKLKELSDSEISVIVTIHGVPLRVREPELSSHEHEEIESLQRKIQTIQSRAPLSSEDRKQSDLLEQQIMQRAKLDQSAAVDSELTMVRAGAYPLERWIQNPYFLGFRDQKLPFAPQQVMLVSRLDGPDLATVRRIIDDTIYAELEGLKGTAYFDARWPAPKSPPQSATAYYDAALHQAAESVKKSLKVVVDDTESVFAPNSCPDAALYAGWYSLATYVDSFSWKRGAIGYHMASAECTSLRKKENQGWCIQTLLHGSVATIGPVAEPYLEAFPPPNIFFPLLTDQHITLGEAFMASVPYLSWQMILLGDPLYRPFPITSQGK